MICSFCNTVNENDYTFCVNCGKVIGKPQEQIYDDGGSVVTQIAPPKTIPSYSNDIFNDVVEKKRSNKLLWLIPLLFVFVAVASVGGYLLIKSTADPTEKFPDHLGLFAQSSDKNTLTEVRSVDSADLFKTKNELLSSNELTVLDPSPSLIFYSDNSINANDLKLVRVDSLSQLGEYHFIDIQIAPIDQKPDQRRLRIAEKLANGVYALARFEGFVDEGSHRLWPFRINDSEVVDNEKALRAATLPLKPRPTPSQTPKIEVPKLPEPEAQAPPGATISYTTTDNLVLRSGPSQNSKKLMSLKKGELVYIIKYSTETETFNGIESRYAQVQTKAGRRGWVFGAFLK